MRIASKALVALVALALVALLCGPAAQAAPPGPRDLRMGSGFGQPGGSAAVHELQRGLVRAGYTPGPIDGLYGPRTRAAVEAFQIQQGLAVDGVAGPRTLARLPIRVAQDERGLTRGATAPAAVRSHPRGAAGHGEPVRSVPAVDGPAATPAGSAISATELGSMLIVVLIVGALLVLVLEPPIVRSLLRRWRWRARRAVLGPRAPVAHAARLSVPIAIAGRAPLFQTKLPPPRRFPLLRRM